jgi:transcriptional regulator of met regulon
MIPLYSYPGSEWNVVEQAKLAHPSVPIVAIINPDNGPGGSQDPNYVAGVNSLRSAGVTVLGYVYTSYAARASASVIADINTYKSWYNVSGIFFDEMSNVQGNAAYYLALSTYAKSIGFGYTVGNPGGPVPTSYIGSVDCIVAYENEGLPNISSLASMDTSFSKNGLAAISYGVDALSTSYTSSASNYVEYIYVTDAGLPNPYSELPPYFSALVAAVDTSSTSSLPSTVTSTLTDTQVAKTTSSLPSTVTSTLTDTQVAKTTSSLTSTVTSTLTDTQVAKTTSSLPSTVTSTLTDTQVAKTTSSLTSTVTSTLTDTQVAKTTSSLPSTVTSTLTDTQVAKTTSQSSIVASTVTETQVVTTSTSPSAVTSTPLNSTTTITSPTKAPVAMGAITILFIVVALGASALAAVLTILVALSKKTGFGLLLRKRHE